MFEAEEVKMVTDKLKVDPGSGLTQSEAQIRLTKELSKNKFDNFGLM